MSRGVEPTLTIVPTRPRLRVTGPGRLERTYQRRIEALAGTVDASRAELDATRRQLEVAGVIERGSGRLLDRIEREAEARRAELESVRGQHHRLMVTLGAVQAENEHLRLELQAAREQARRLAPPRRPGLLRRLLGPRA